MREHETKKYPNGGAARRPRRPRARTAEEIAFDEVMRDRFAKLLTPQGTRPSEAIQKVCQGEQRPFSKAARRVIEAADAAVPLDEALGIAKDVEWFIRKVYERRRPKAPQRDQQSA